MADRALRLASPVDAETLGALHVASWRETYAGILPDRMLAGLSVESRSAMWGEVLAAPDAFGCAAVLVAVSDGHAVGFGSCGRQRDPALRDAGFSGEFGTIYVLRAWQGQGVGRSLMTAMANILSACGHGAAALWVLRRNASACSFYHRLGGVAVAERIEDHPEAPLIEEAYGWRDLSVLTR